jgi:SAM-dependent methyltransferase
MSEAPARRVEMLPMLEGLHLAHAAGALEAEGILDDLREPRSAAELARRHGLDPEILGGTLEYLARRTNLVTKVGAAYAAGEGYDGPARFMLNLYAGAFGPAASRLRTALRRPSAAGGLVDRKAQARAFERGSGAAPPVAAVVRQLGLDRLLDLGCGSGILLSALADETPTFRGWGVDSNPRMVRAARKRLREAGAAARVTILEGDCFELARSVPAAILDEVRTILASQVANELFRGGGAAFVGWLARLKAALPGRILIISDYYGRLHPECGEADGFTLLHDFCQLISGQGVPPAGQPEWARLYAEAGCDLRAVIDDDSATRFVHILRT